MKRFVKVDGYHICADDIMCITPMMKMGDTHGYVIRLAEGEYIERKVIPFTKIITTKVKKLFRTIEVRTVVPDSERFEADLNELANSRDAFINQVVNHNEGAAEPVNRPMHVV